MSEEKNPNKNSLLKKKTDASMTQQHDPNANSKFLIFFPYLLEKNPFTARRQTASQNFSYEEGNNKEAESDTDDYDEFYNDKSFLNTGMAKSGQNYGQRGTYQGFDQNAVDTQSYLNRVSPLLYLIYIEYEPVTASTGRQ